MAWAAGERERDTNSLVAVQMFGDAEYLRSVLNMLPGVDPSDPSVQSMLRSLRDGPADRKEDGAGDDKPGEQQGA